MYSYFTHKITSADGLSQEIWQYWFNDREMVLVLDAYAIVERKSRRNNFVTVAQWLRRDRPVVGIRRLSREDVPVRDDVRAEVLRQFVARVTVE